MPSSRNELAGLIPPDPASPRAVDWQSLLSWLFPVPPGTTPQPAGAAPTTPTPPAMRSSGVSPRNTAPTTPAASTTKKTLGDILLAPDDTSSMGPLQGTNGQSGFGAGPYGTLPPSRGSGFGQNPVLSTLPARGAPDASMSGLQPSSILPSGSPGIDSSGISPAGSSFLGGLGSALGGLDTQDWLGIGGLGIAGLGTYLQNKSANKQLDLANQIAQQQLALQQQQLGLQGRQAALNATQLNPYTQQNDLASTALRRVLLDKGPAQVALGSATPLDPGKADRAAVANQYLNDSTLADIGSQFEDERQRLATGSSPDDEAAAADADANRAAVQAALLNGVDTSEKKSGGGFWKTLAKIGTVAAPIVAAPFTGGASLALIGAGAGAANSALNGGGLKGALLGAGLGAIPGVGTSGGLARGAVAPAIGAGLKQAGVTALKNPLPILSRVR